MDFRAKNCSIWIKQVCGSRRDCPDTFLRKVCCLTLGAPISRQGKRHRHRDETSELAIEIASTSPCRRTATRTWARAVLGVPVSDESKNQIPDIAVFRSWSLGFRSVTSLRTSLRPLGWDQRGVKEVTTGCTAHSPARGRKSKLQGLGNRTVYRRSAKIARVPLKPLSSCSPRGSR
jgi:hypothetical protein